MTSSQRSNSVDHPEGVRWWDDGEGSASVVDYRPLSAHPILKCPVACSASESIFVYLIFRLGIRTQFHSMLASLSLVGHFDDSINSSIKIIYLHFLIS